MNRHSDFARIAFFYRQLQHNIQHNKNKKDLTDSLSTLMELARKDVPIVKYKDILNMMVLCKKKAQPHFEF